MTRILPCFILFVSCAIGAIAQDLSGQWKGSFIDKSASYGSFSGDKCDYVLDLEFDGIKVSGTSYTYFTEGGKRYFTICNVTGTADQKKNYIEIQEINRTKTNIPSNVNNCFQVHKLVYSKHGHAEILEGNWVPAKNQSGNCGFGITSLTRRTLSGSAYLLRHKKEKINPVKNEDHLVANQKSKPAPKQNVHHIKSKDGSHSTNLSSGTSNNTVAAVTANTQTEIQNPIATTNSEQQEVDNKYGIRKNTLLKTIEVESHTVKVDLYDNGYVDGDSISLFFNEKLLLTGKRLTEKAISLLLKIDDNDPRNELVMYAENLGSIAPNTALMVVTDGPNRYEVRITSDLEKSGLIRFVKKK